MFTENESPVTSVQNIGCYKIKIGTNETIQLFYFSLPTARKPQPGLFEIKE